MLVVGTLIGTRAGIAAGIAYMSGENAATAAFIFWVVVTTDYGIFSIALIEAAVTACIAGFLVSEFLDCVAASTGVFGARVIACEFF